MKNLLLKGSVAIVTGGQGLLGREYVKTLAEAGAKVAIFDIIGLENPVDITKKTAVAKAFEKVEKELGVPTILVNNAGIDSPPGASAGENGFFENYPERAWDAVLDSHLKGAFLVSQAFIRSFVKSNSKNGSIINISSIYGVVSPDQSLYAYRRKRGEEFYKPVAYSVAKAGMIGFTKWLAGYFGERKIPIRANTLVLGGVFSGQEKKFVSQYKKKTLLGRMADFTDYNQAVLFLASDASSYMTGSELVIDGGLTAR